MNKYLLSYLKDYYNDTRMDRVLDYFKVDFDNYLYAYGSQFGKYDNLELEHQHLYGGKNISKKRTWEIKSKLQSIKAFVRHQAYCLVSRRINQSISDKREKLKRKVLFVDHVSIKIRNEFAKKGIKTYCIEEFNNNKYPGIRRLFEWYDSLNKLSFRERLNVDRYDCLDEYIKTIQETFRGFDGLFVGNDEYFIPKIFIDAFKNINIPTYNWSHGIQSTVGIEKRTDYTLVWGVRLKKSLIEEGKNPDSIIVSGNINYFDMPRLTCFRNTLDDILVCTSATVAHIRHNWEYDKFEKWDRSLLLTYIYSVEKVLKSLGIKHARLRLHPINNKLWVEKFIDTDFYSIDYLPIDQSLIKATLVIGPTSSTFVEALHRGCTYLIYEPGESGKNITDIPLVPPFDGSDSDIKVAFTEKQLKELIETSYTYKIDVLEKYMLPFNIDSIVQTLGKRS